MTKNNIMLSIIKNNQIDCPQPMDEVYFTNLDEARNKGIELGVYSDCGVLIKRRILWN